MKKNFDNMAVLGILGIVFLIFYFVSQFFQSDLGTGDINKLRYGVFYKLFSNLGYKTKKNFKNINSDSVDCLYFYFDYVEQDKALISKAVEKVKKGGALFIAGVTSSKEPIHNRKIVNGKVGEVSVHKSINRDVGSFEVNYASFFEKNNSATPLVYFEGGVILEKIKSGKGTIYLLSHSSLLDNESLKNEEIAVMINNLLKDYYDKNIYFLEREIDFAKTVSPILVLFKGNMLFITLQVLLIGILFAAWKAVRFGNPVPYKSYVRRSLSNHLEGISNFYKKTNSTKIISEINQKYFIRKISKLLGIKSNLPMEAVMKKIKDNAGKDTGEINDLIEKSEFSSIYSLLLNEVKRQEVLGKFSKKV